MVDTRKFSQFVSGGQIVPTDQPVGLETGANTIWTGASGGGGGNSAVLPQPVPPVAVGQWVKITLTSGLYAGAQADNAGDAEVAGLVVSANATTFTLQQSGYVPGAMAIFGMGPLGPGLVYFLSPNNPAVMIPNDATINGQVSRPVFYADTTDSGWILPYRGLIVGGAAPSGSGGTDSNLHTVTQPLHGFTPGTVLRVSTLNVGGQPITYTRAQADTLANAQAVGIVVLNPPPTANQFTIQFAGFNANSLTTDYLGNPLDPATVYYLSSTNPGLVTSVDPETTGGVSKPIYITEQGLINAGQNSGYILPQRPLTNANSPTTGSVLLATATATSQAVLAFNNVFSAQYNNYEIVWRNVIPTSQLPLSSMIAQIGITNIPTYQTTNYSGTLFVINNAACIAGPALTTGFNCGVPQYSTPQFAGSGSMLLTNCNSLTSYKTMTWDSANVDPQFATTVRGGGAQSWAGLTAVTSIRFFFSTSNILSGTFSIYGLNQ